MFINPELETLQFSVNGSTAILTIDNPAKKNALSSAAHRDLLRFVDYIDSVPELRAGIITATGDRVFTSGNDVSEFTPPDGYFPDNPLLEAINRIWRSNTPVIFAINGHCVGGGFEMALAADIVIMADNATFSLPETNLGIIPGACGIQRLARCCGIAVAKEMVLTGRRMSAAEAVTRGLAIKAVPLDSLMDEALSVAELLAGRAPLALAMAKKSCNAALDMDYHSAELMEQWGIISLINTQDSKEAISAFMEKRKPVFSGK
jgi:enoyl-CoA hydratase/carnithine racemase